MWWASPTSKTTARKASSWRSRKTCRAATAPAASSRTGSAARSRTSAAASGSTIRDAHPHGALTVAEVIQKSSNVGTVKMAMQMQPREMWELFTQVGFGQKPQIAFPGAVTGRLRPYKTWRPIEQATMSYGYGLSASLFQIARAYSVFAHDGELIPASMVRSPDPASGLRVLSPKTALAVREMLHMVTSD